MAFEWFKLYKWEEQIEREISDRVFDYILDFYKVEHVADLSKEQMDEVLVFMEEMWQESPVRLGFTNFYNDWEDATWEPGKDQNDNS